MGSGITYEERGVLIDIRKTKDNYNKDNQPRYFNCNVYEHMVKDCRKPKKEKEIRKCYKYNKVGHLAKNCMLGQKIKNKSIQEVFHNENKENNNKEATTKKK